MHRLAVKQRKGVHKQQNLRLQKNICQENYSECEQVYAESTKPNADIRTRIYPFHVYDKASTIQSAAHYLVLNSILSIGLCFLFYACSYSHQRHLSLLTRIPVFTS